MSKREAAQNLRAAHLSDSGRNARHGHILRIRAAIRAGEYLTAAKIEAVVSRLHEELTFSQSAAPEPTRARRAG